MINSAIDRDTMIKLFSEAATWQAEAVREMVSRATQQALEARATALATALANVHRALAPAQAASGAVQNLSTEVDFEAMLSKACAGIDAALLQAVQANLRVLQQFTGQGADPRGSTGGPLQVPWE